MKGDFKLKLKQNAGKLAASYLRAVPVAVANLQVVTHAGKHPAHLPWTAQALTTIGSCFLPPLWVFLRAEADTIDPPPAPPTPPVP